jgi:anti-sigma regulatory factor (Ser/Thr protein kinase)
VNDVFNASDLISYCLDISIPSDAYAVAQYSRNMASELGFSKHEVGMISIAVAEIATNVVRYALPGKASIRAICAGKGIEITIEDEGNGIQDIDAAMVDGFSTHSEPSIGKGLGAANRSVEELIFNKSDRTGTSITLRHFLKPVLDDIEVSVKSFPAVGAAVNRDQYIIKPYQAEKMLVILSDFSEFGDRFPDYADAFKSVIDSHYTDPLDALLQKCQSALQKINGKCLSRTLLMRVLPDRFEVIRCGNIGLYIDSNAIPSRYIESAMVNNEAVTSCPPIERFPREKESTVLMHSDGIRLPSIFNIESGTSLEQQARSLFDVSAHDNDDATLLVLRGEYER